MADTTKSDVQDVYGDTALSSTEQDNLVAIANRLGNQNYSGRLATIGETEGSEKDFKTFLAAHIWALNEGEAQSESQGGGSISYNVTAGDVEDGLSETRYGRMAKTYLRSNAGVAVVKSRSR